MTEPTITDERQLTPEMRAELTQAVTKILAEMTPDERYAAVAEAAGVIKAERDRYRDDAERLRAVLREVEWGGRDEYSGDKCPACGAYKPQTEDDLRRVIEFDRRARETAGTPRQCPPFDEAAWREQNMKGHAPACRLAAALRGSP